MILMCETWGNTYTKAASQGFGPLSHIKKYLPSILGDNIKGKSASSIHSILKCDEIRDLYRLFDGKTCYNKLMFKNMAMHPERFANAIGILKHRYDVFFNLPSSNDTEMPQPSQPHKYDDDNENSHFIGQTQQKSSKLDGWSTDDDLNWEDENQKLLDMYQTESFQQLIDKILL